MSIMEGTITTARSMSHVLAKDNDDTRLPSPPPAYTPCRNVPLQSITARQLRQSRATQSLPILIDRSPLATTLLRGSAMAADADDSDDDLSPISLRINTSITISSDNNMVCLTDTPANHANAIAKAVVKALQESSSGQCGIPMIDEEGRPRPVRIHVDAGMTIDGAGNVIGNENVVREVARQKGQTLRRPRQESEEETAREAGPSKRRCSSR